MKTLIYISISLGLLLSYTGCKKDEIEEPIQTATTTVKMNFNHYVDGTPIVMDTLSYTIANGDTISIQNLKYFISALTLHRANESEIVLFDKHYVDEEIPETLTYTFGEKVPSGQYSGISFTYGFTNADNKSGMFTSTPENLMFWPEPMGGGYHYQQIDGQYLDNGVKKFYNFHTGSLDNTDYSIKVILANTAFTVKNNTVTIDLQMEIQSWFANPVEWDFDYYGATIMGNHEAQAIIQDNGHDVFAAIVN
jgi:hypothetical protein